ncbi:MAG: VOC family protein [Candidatus Methylomirabilales bacterium]
MNGIHHIGVLVRSIAESLPLYTDLLGLQADPPFELPEQRVRAVFLRAGDDRIELLEPLTPDCPLGQVLAKRGEGLLHICLEVDDLEASLRRLEGRGVRLVDLHGWRSPIGLVAFLHPKSCHGVSIELRQAGAGDPGAAAAHAGPAPVEAGESGSRREEGGS